MSTTIEEKFAIDQKRALGARTQSLLSTLIQPEQYVGEVFSLSYESALVEIHDYHRKQVGGIPSLCFLIATRLDPSQTVDYTQEDTSVLLLRVMDAADLPNEAEARRIRVEAAQRVSGEPARHWDEQQVMDAATANVLSFAGIRCRVIGTFHVDARAGIINVDDTSLVLFFGSDLSNYYPNRGLKVYKPKGAALSAIVNFRDPSRPDVRSSRSVDVGKVRYASTHRSFQGIADVSVSLLPADLLAQKTALFGMTRTGKSNTTKIIVQSVFNLRFGEPDDALRVGQIVFDPNGEYANENMQDAGPSGQRAAISKVWRGNPAGQKEDVVVYGLRQREDDPSRKLMLLNFLDDANLQVGKDIINSYLAEE